jgi:hypothetical protein
MKSFIKQLIFVKRHVPVVQSISIAVEEYDFLLVSYVMYDSHIIEKWLVESEPRKNSGGDCKMG